MPNWVIVKKMETKSIVPNEIGICVDDAGFPGLLFLPVHRDLEGVREFLALVKDHYTNAYLVEFHENENLRGALFSCVKRTGPFRARYIT